MNRNMKHETHRGGGVSWPKSLGLETARAASVKEALTVMMLTKRG